MYSTNNNTGELEEIRIVIQSPNADTNMNNNICKSSEKFILDDITSKLEHNDNNIEYNSPKDKFPDFSKLITEKMESHQIFIENSVNETAKSFDSLLLSEDDSQNNFKLPNKWHFGSSGYEDPNSKVWKKPSKVLTLECAEDLESFLNGFKYMHPKHQSNCYLAINDYCPSVEEMNRKEKINKNGDFKGCSYICLKFNANRQRDLYMSKDLFYLFLKKIILFLVSRDYDESSKNVFESIKCIESLSKINRSEINRKNYTIKIWKTNEVDNLTVIEHIVKIFSEFDKCSHIKYFCEIINCVTNTINEISCKTIKFQETLVQRKKLKEIFENYESFNDSDKANLITLSNYIANPLIGIKIKNYS